MLKILQSRLQKYVDWELPEVQAGFWRGRGTTVETKLLTCTGLWRKPESSRKTSTSASLTTQKPLTVWTTTNHDKFLKKWECLTTLSISWEIYRWDRKQQLELDMEQLIGSKLGKEYDKAVYCLPAYLTYIQNTSCRTEWIPNRN